MGTILIDCKNEKLLNDMLDDICKYFNEKQDNFNLSTKGFDVPSEKVSQKKAKEFFSGKSKDEMHAEEIKKNDGTFCPRCEEWVDPKTHECFGGGKK